VSKAGVIASLRFYFAFFRLDDERYGDLAPTSRKTVSEVDAQQRVRR